MGENAECKLKSLLLLGSVFVTERLLTQEFWGIKKFVKRQPTELRSALSDWGGEGDLGVSTKTSEQLPSFNPRHRVVYAGLFHDSPSSGDQEVFYVLLI